MKPPRPLNKHHRVSMTNVNEPKVLVRDLSVFPMSTPHFPTFVLVTSLSLAGRIGISPEACGSVCGRQ